VYTVAETEVFAADAKSIWSEEDQPGFIGWIAANPLAGDVIPGSGGCRKVRWARSGMGKRGGVRVIYFNRLENGVIWLLGDLRQGSARKHPSAFIENHQRGT